MAKYEGRVHSPQWKVHRRRRGLPRSQPSLRSCDTHSILVAEHLARTESETDSSLEGTRQNQQILASSFNNKLARARLTFALLVIRMNSIDCKYLRRNAVNASTRCREQKITVSICHLQNHPRSSRRRRSTNPPPSGKLIVRYSLFRQGKVRMSSTNSRHLLSP